MNGWQRLWILVSIILLVPTFLIAIAFQPSSYEINQYTQGKLIEFAVNNDPSLKGAKPWEIAADLKDIEPGDFVQLQLDYLLITRKPTMNSPPSNALKKLIEREFPGFIQK